MLYHFHELQRLFLDPVATVTGVSARALQHRSNPFAWLPQVRALGASQALMYRLAKRYPKQPWDLEGVTAEVVTREPFCELVRFAAVRDGAAPRFGRPLPRVLVVAPLSGHHATLLRDTVRSLIAEHEVFITDWVDAREVPLSAGVFRLDDYVHAVMRFIRRLGAASLHVIAVCQPTVPVLAAVSLLAQAGEPTPRTLTLMGGPIDARKSPTEVNRLAMTRSYAWFEDNMIHVVPWPHEGRGRRVYPGFLQLAAFVMMNPAHHAGSYARYWLDAFACTDAGARDKRAQHERFYDEYNAVLDMDAAYYLDTVRVVFQEHRLAKGTWDVGGVRVEPAAISETALLTIEGEDDDISGLGQTEAAHTLAVSIPSARRKHHVAKGVGHYGIFSGSKWREQIYPHVRDHIQSTEES